MLSFLGNVRISRHTAPEGAEGPAPGPVPGAMASALGRATDREMVREKDPTRACTGWKRTADVGGGGEECG